MIQDKCYYFEKNVMNYETAQNNCKGKFGLFTSNLIEPKNLEELEAILEAAKNHLNSPGWIHTGLINLFGTGVFDTSHLLFGKNFKFRTLGL